MPRYRMNAAGNFEAVPAAQQIPRRRPLRPLFDWNANNLIIEEPQLAAPPELDQAAQYQAMYDRVMANAERGEVLARRRKRPDPPAPPEVPAYEPPKGADMTKPVFFMPYDTLEEVNLRLVHSIIRLHDQPVYIVEAVQEQGKFVLWFKHDIDGALLKHIYEEGSGFDLSPFHARYMSRGGYAYWVYRRPMRGCYKQGVCSKNTFQKLVGKGDNGRENGVGVAAFLQVLARDPAISHVSEGLKTIRNQRDLGLNYFGAVLSPHVALYFSDKKYRVEYKGSPIGVLDVESKTLQAETPEITANLWAIRRLDQVGISLG